MSSPNPLRQVGGYEPTIGTLADPHVFWEQLNRILSGDLRFDFEYQPIVDLQRGMVAGYESLARFPEEIGLAPDVCFHAAQDYGKRLDLEALVFRTSLDARFQLPDNCFLSVNVSPYLLLSERWHSVMADVADLRCVVIEITEQDLINDYELTRQRINELRAKGAVIAVDDAGAGYASLKHTMELKPAFLKLDRYFIGNCREDFAKATLIEMLGRAADRLDAWIVGEGVETAEELDELMRLGVPLGQGYYLGLPQTEMLPLNEEMAAFLRMRAKHFFEPSRLRAHMEYCPIYSNPHEAREAFKTSTPTVHAACVDRWSRLVELLELHPLVGLRSIITFMTTHLSNDLEDLLYRALLRPPNHRFDPIIVLDERGRFEGLLRIDRLMRASLDGVQDIAPNETPSPDRLMKSFLAMPKQNWA